MRWRLTGCFVLILTAYSPVIGEQLWHTTPDKWKQPRIFHSPFRSDFTERLAIGRDLIAVVGGEHRESPNKAYFYMIQKPDTRSPGPWNTVVSINNERKGLFQILIKDHSNWDVDVKWVNEKLLFVRVWWGRVLGTDLILDVEKESVVSKEMINDGAIPFQQWKQEEQPDRRIGNNR